MKVLRNDNFTLINGECIEVMEKLITKGIKVDAIICDPPYELETHGGGNRKQWKNIHNNFISDLSNGIDYNNVFEKMLSLCKVPNILIFCSNKQINKIMNWFEQKNLSVTLLCWHKEGYVPFANGKHMSDVEFIIYIRGKKAHWNNEIDIKLKSKVLKDTWRIKSKQHPTQKSIEIMKHLVSLHSFENDIVLDPFMGSGSTGVACKNLNRKFIGIELEEKYFNIAIERIKGEI